MTAERSTSKIEAISSALERIEQAGEILRLMSEALTADPDTARCGVALSGVLTLLYTVTTPLSELVG